MVRQTEREKMNKGNVTRKLETCSIMSRNEKVRKKQKKLFVWKRSLMLTRNRRISILGTKTTFLSKVFLASTIATVDWNDRHGWLSTCTLGQGKFSLQGGPMWSPQLCDVIGSNRDLTMVMSSDQSCYCLYDHACSSFENDIMIPYTGLPCIYIHLALGY